LVLISYWILIHNKIRGGKNQKAYPQPEGELGDSMIIHGNTLGMDNNFGQSLVCMGESLRKLADVKYQLEDNVKERFLDPLSTVKEQNLKRIAHLRKKTEDKRLEFDAKNRKQPPPEDLKCSEDKFHEYKSQAHMAMSEFISNEFEKMDNLIDFAKQLSNYHMQCNEILQESISELNEKKKKIQLNNVREKYKNPKSHNSTTLVSSPPDW